MNLSHLYYFKKLVEVQHYTRAAKELFIAQPTLSAAISQLEKELGAPLFQKHTRSVRLTPYGQDFYRYVNIALNNLDKGIEVVQERAGMRQSTVRVGAIYEVQDKVWARTVRSFREYQHRDVTVDVRQDQATQLLAGLKDGTYDVIFTNAPVEEADIVCAPYRSFDLAVAVNKLNMLANRSAVTLDQLQQFPVISYDVEQDNYKHLGELFKKQGIAVDMAFNDAITMCSLVAVDITYAAITMNSFVLNSFEDIVTLRLDDAPRGLLQTYFCFKDDKDAPLVVRSFEEAFLGTAW